MIMQRRCSQRAAAEVARENICGIHDFEQDSWGKYLYYYYY